MPNPNNSDSDGDILSDYEEIYTHNTLPNTYDSDGDGLSDGDEVSNMISSYHAINEYFNYFDAIADAESRGGHLVTVTSQKEWDQVKATIDTLDPI